jgi:PPP family 3-phenylpropionic acid transporter
VPYWRLSGFYLFYFASLGALVPYWSLYLKHLEFSARDIGTLMALVMATKIVSPNVWGWIADHTGHSMRIVRLGCLLGALSFAGVFVGHDYWWLVVVMLVFSFFWNAALPQFEATTFNHLGEHSHRYSGIRLWGSIGFIVAVAALGPVLDSQGAGILPWVLMALFVGLWLSSLSVPERAAGHLHLEHSPLRKVLLRPEVAALLLVCFLLQASHGPYYTFYTIYLEGHGYSRSVIGQLWALGVIAEVGVFLIMHRWVPRFGLRRLLIASLALTALRWVLIGQFPQLAAVLIGAQLLHAASFGIYHAVAIQLIHRYFTGRHQGRGQALYSSLSFGAGGAAGSYVSGIGWDSLGAGSVYLIAAATAALATLVAWLWIRPSQTI